MADVTIYTRKSCGFCTAAKRLLDERGVSYDEYDATFSDRLRSEMVKRAGGCSTFPQVFVGKTHIGGCDELYALANGETLDEMLRSVVRRR